MVFPFLVATLLLLGAAIPASAQTPFPGFVEAVQMAEEGRNAEALAAFRQLAALNPNDRVARLWIARMHDEMRNPELAEPVYRSILLEDPANLEAMLGVGSALLARNEIDEAIEILEAVEAREPQNATVLVLLGRAHRLGGRQTLAIAYFERAVALAASEENVFRLKDARLSYLHRIEARVFSEQFSGNTPSTRSGDIAVNYRLTERLRVLGRGQVQRKFAFSERRGGGGLEWRRGVTTLRGHAILGPDNRVMPEGDYLGEIEHTRGRATWTAGIRFFDFTGAQTSVLSPAVAWLPDDRVEVSLRYAASWTETSTSLSRDLGHTTQLRGAYRLSRRVWFQAGYARGVEDFENFSLDRIGDFRANTASGGARIELPTLLTIIGNYEHQWRSGNIDMGRVTVTLQQRF